MNKKSLDNKMLDTIGRRLIERTSVSEDEIDKIVANPELFTFIHKRMKANGSVQKPSFVQLLHIKRYSAVLASLAVIVIAGVAASRLLRTGDQSFAAGIVSISAEMPETARPNLNPPLRKGSDPTPGRAANHEVTGTNIAEKASFRQPVRPQRPKVDVRQADSDFYAVLSAAGMDDAAGDSRIIRVDMPRSSLFAMGVNIPLENGAETVKADLLVGPDGITRAIRVVK